MQSMSGWRLRFGVGAGAVGVVAEMSLSAGWLSVDWGVGGLCPKGLGLRSCWALYNTNWEKRLQLWNCVLQKKKQKTSDLDWRSSLTCWSRASLRWWSWKVWRSWPFWTELVHRGRGGSWVRWSQTWSLGHQPFPCTTPHLQKQKSKLHCIPFRDKTFSFVCSCNSFKIMIYIKLQQSCIHF